MKGKAVGARVTHKAPSITLTLSHSVLLSTNGTLRVIVNNDRKTPSRKKAADPFPGRRRLPYKRPTIKEDARDGQGELARGEEETKRNELSRRVLRRAVCWRGGGENCNTVLGWGSANGGTPWHNALPLRHFKRQFTQIAPADFSTCISEGGSIVTK